MSPHVTVIGPDGNPARLLPGAIVGRSRSAALCVPDHRVAEAAVLLSLRGGAFHWLALRGRMTVDGELVEQALVAEGQHLGLARGVTVVVDAVALPDRSLGVRLDGGAAQALWASTYSVLAGPPAELVPGAVRGAAAMIHSDGEGWWLRTRHRGVALVDGLTHTVEDGPVVEVVEVPVTDVGQTSRSTALPSPLTLTVRYDSAEITRRDRRPVRLTGLKARLLTELVQLDGPAPWEVVARELWTGDRDRDWLRKAFDREVRKIRLLLRENGVRDDLVFLSTGRVELGRYPGDQIVDAS